MESWPEKWERAQLKVADAVIEGFLVILQVRYQVFHRVAPTGGEQPHYTDAVWGKL